MLFQYSSIFAQSEFEFRNTRILVYKKNGEGFVHENVPYAAEAIMKMGKQHGFVVDTTSDLLFRKRVIPGYTSGNGE
ncbi:hypothetical protein GGU45_002998 [Niabella hirudinis]